MEDGSGVVLCQILIFNQEKVCVEGAESLVNDIFWPPVAVGAPTPHTADSLGLDNLHPRGHVEPGKGGEGTNLSLSPGPLVKRIPTVWA